MEDLRAQGAEAAEKVANALGRLKKAEDEVAELARTLAVEPARGSYRTLRFRVRVGVSG